MRRDERSAQHPVLPRGVGRISDRQSRQAVRRTGARTLVKTGEIACQDAEADPVGNDVVDGEQQHMPFRVQSQQADAQQGPRGEIERLPGLLPPEGTRDVFRVVATREIMKHDRHG